MSELICQSCGMPMSNDELKGTNTDGSKNNKYCTYCYQNGNFSAPNVSMQEMIDTCIPFMVQEGLDEESARKHLNELFPKLKRWA